MNIEDVIERLRTQCEAAGSATKWADANGVSQTQVAAVLRGAAPPGPKICRVIGVVRTVSHTYQDMEKNDGAQG